MATVPINSYKTISTENISNDSRTFNSFNDENPNFLQPSSNRIPLFSSQSNMIADDIRLLNYINEPENLLQTLMKPNDKIPKIPIPNPNFAKPIGFHQSKTIGKIIVENEIPQPHPIIIGLPLVNKPKPKLTLPFVEPKPIPKANIIENLVLDKVINKPNAKLILPAVPEIPQTILQNIIPQPFPIINLPLVNNLSSKLKLPLHQSKGASKENGIEKLVLDEVIQNLPPPVNKPENLVITGRVLNSKLNAEKQSDLRKNKQPVQLLLNIDKEIHQKSELKNLDKLISDKKIPNLVLPLINAATTPTTNTIKNKNNSKAKSIVEVNRNQTNITNNKSKIHTNVKPKAKPIKLPQLKLSSIIKIKSQTQPTNFKTSKLQPLKEHRNVVSITTKTKSNVKPIKIPQLNLTSIIKIKDQTKPKNKKNANTSKTSKPQILKEHRYVTNAINISPIKTPQLKLSSLIEMKNQTVKRSAKSAK